MKLVWHFPFFEYLTTEAAEYLNSHIEKRFFAKGQLLYQEGAFCSQVTTILRGQIRIYKIANCGREVTLHRIGPGEICTLGLNSILSDALYPAYAEAVTDTELLLVPALIFKRLVIRELKLQEFIFSYIAKNTRTLVEKMAELAVQTVDQRVC